MQAEPELLVTATGRDRPGLTTALCGALAATGARILDVEQIVIHDRYIIGILAAGGAGEAETRKVVERTAAELRVSVEVEPTRAQAPDGGQPRHYVTVLGQPLPAAALAAVTARIAACGANIDRMVRLARYPIMSFELLISGGDHDTLRRELVEEAAAQHVDVAVQRATLYRRAKRLICLDVDSTLVQREVIEELAAHAGCRAQVTELTLASMAGELDFETSLRERVALLKGLPEEAVHAVTRDLELTPGARTLVRTLRRLGFTTAIVSGGFKPVTDRLQALLGIDYAHANTLEVEDGRLTGRLVGPIVDRAAKAEALERFAEEAGVPLSQTVAVGDGANDLDMLSRAGVGIAFNAKPAVRRAADTAVSVPYLDAVLFVLGITREEVEAADEEDPEFNPPSHGPPAAGA